MQHLFTYKYTMIKQNLLEAPIQMPYTSKIAI